MEFDEDPPAPDADLLPEEEASDGAIRVAEEFFQAIRDSDHDRLWGLFTENAQAYVLNIAIQRGMDFDLASRFRQGKAEQEESDEYLSGLLEGIRRDLRGVDIDALAFESTAEPHAALQVRVRYLVVMDMAIGDVRPSIPAGSLILEYQEDDECWKVERLNPKPG